MWCLTDDLESGPGGVEAEAVRTMTGLFPGIAGSIQG